MSVHPHAPGRALDYAQDWTGYLQQGETITSSTWSVDPAGPTLSGATETDGKTQVVMDDVEMGQVYMLINRVETSTGRDDERVMTVRGMRQ